MLRSVDEELPTNVERAHGTLLALYLHTQPTCFSPFCFIFLGSLPALFSASLDHCTFSLSAPQHDGSRQRNEEASSNRASNPQPGHSTFSISYITEVIRSPVRQSLSKSVPRAKHTCTLWHLRAPRKAGRGKVNEFSTQYVLLASVSLLFHSSHRAEVWRHIVRRATS